MNPRHDSPWLPHVDAELRRLWADKVPTKAIAEALVAFGAVGITKNAVVGRVHRLGLKPRPNPVGSFKFEAPAAVRPPTPRGPTSVTGAIRPAGADAPGWFDDEEPCRCRWPLWPDRKRAGRPQEFCKASRAPENSYCEKHAAVACPGRWNYGLDREEAA